MDTQDSDYTDRLRTREQAWWKRALNVQGIYRWNLRRHSPGRTLDVGCGLGRNLLALPEGSVGVDHNAASVATARERGFSAYTVEEFLVGDAAVEGGYDTLLFAHVIEHLAPDEGTELVRSYLPYLRDGGHVLFICPQERGYRSDPTHVSFTTSDDLEALSRRVGLVPERSQSFPFPRAVGKVFTYNEWVVRARKPVGASAS